MIKIIQVKLSLCPHTWFGRGSPRSIRDTGWASSWSGPEPPGRRGWTSFPTPTKTHEELLTRYFQTLNDQRKPSVWLLSSCVLHTRALFLWYSSMSSPWNTRGEHQGAISHIESRTWWSRAAAAHRVVVGVHVWDEDRWHLGQNVVQRVSVVSAELPEGSLATVQQHRLTGATFSEKDLL